MVVFKTGFYFYSCGSDVDGSAVLCSAAGRACFESAFPVLHSGIFWTDCCADSDYCEVSYHFTFALLYRYFAVPVFSCGVGCCCILDGLVLWFCSGGRLYYDGWRGFSALLGYCMFMIIAFIK